MTVTAVSRRPSWLFRILTVALCVVVTFRAVPLNVTLDVPAAMKTLDGTDSTATLLLDTENVNPPEGATPCERLIRNSVTLPLAIVAGVAVKAPSAG